MGAATSTLRLRPRYPFLVSRAGTAGQPYPSASETLPGEGMRPAGLVHNTWGQASAVRITRPRLTADLDADVVVVGAGVAGLSAALALLKAGVQDVAVLEKGAVAAGMSGRTTAHIMLWLDDHYHLLARAGGPALAAAAAAAQRDAVAWVAATVAEEGIECAHAAVPGYLIPETPADVGGVLTEEFEAARAAGLGEVEWADLGGGPEVGGITCALRFPSGEVSPVAYCQGLAAAVERRGGRIFEHTPVKTFHVDGSGDLGRGGTVTLRDTPGAVVRARSAIVIATDSPINRNLALHTQQSPWRSYVVGLRVPKGAIARALWWNTEDEYKYARLCVDAPGHDVLVVGGADHEVGQAPPLASERAGGFDPWADLEAWARARWPAAGERLHAWSGIVFEPADGLGMAGWEPALPSNLPVGSGGGAFIITGDSGQGFTHAAIAAQVAAGLIGGSPTPAWAGIFNPARFTATRAPRLAVPAMAHEALATARGFKDRLVPSMVDVEGVGPNCGAVGQAGFLSKVAVYRDGAGTLHRMSGVCPHMKCALSFNPRERTFDCCCHGSSFDRTGACVSGPATSDLAPLATAEE